MTVDFARGTYTAQVPTQTLCFSVQPTETYLKALEPSEIQISWSKTWYDQTIPCQYELDQDVGLSVLGGKEYPRAVHAPEISERSMYENENRGSSSFCEPNNLSRIWQR